MSSTATLIFGGRWLVVPSETAERSAQHTLDTTEPLGDVDAGDDPPADPGARISSGQSSGVTA